MKVSREQAQQNRDAVVEAAGRLFRERGFDGIGVAELMKTVGLTHGGFYGQFGSKEELAAEACALAFERSTEKWQRAVDAAPDAGVAAIADFYLAPAHRDDPGKGCVAAGLAGDAARAGPQVRQVLQDGVESLVGVLAGTMPERTAKARRRHALADFSAMVGAVVLARAVADEAFSQEILEAVRERL
jgi:TetR/AcrR family transcriptional repressor of nem operon